jgi:GntR family transcriptional regulator, transcriptional repressor for pyruvate dehydrogenase complex
VTDPRIYVRIADQVRRMVLDGTLASGQPVPLVKYLAQSWNTDRHTAAKALHLLAGEGLIRRYPGPAGYRVIYRSDPD